MTTAAQPTTGVTSEMLVTLPLPHGYTYAGMVDHIEDGVLIDWKTTANPADYARTLPLRLQADCYALAAREAGHVISDVQYRMVARPALRMKSAPTCKLEQKLHPKPTIKQRKKETEDEFAARLTKWHEENPPETDDQFAARVAKWEAANPPETADEFEDRCFVWLTTSEGVIVEESIHLNEARLQAAMRFMNRATLRANAIYSGEDEAEMNPSACSRYGRSCEYADLCTAKVNGGDWRDIASERFGHPSPDKAVHPELPAPYTTDRTALTFSGMLMRVDCEQRFSFKYLAALVRDDDGEPEAIRVGSLFHKGVEVYGRTGDLDAALDAINALSDEAPAIGDMVAKQVEMTAKARAMVRAAAIKWPVEDQWQATADDLRDLVDDFENRDEVPLRDIINRARSLMARIDSLDRLQDTIDGAPPEQPAPPPPADLPF